MEVLKRQPLPEVEVGMEPVDVAVAELGEQAHKVLGYRGLKSEVDTRVAQMYQKQKPVNFVTVLRHLEIQPFAEWSVDAYKKRRLAESLGFLAVHHTTRKLVNVFSWAFAIVSFWAFFHRMPVGEEALWPWMKFHGAGYLALTSAFVLLVGWGMENAAMAERWSWKTVKLQDYQEPIPAFVLRKALAIKDLLPNAEFTVDHLVYTAPEQQPQDDDPFLYVSYDGQGFYVDVWQEPKFELKI